MLTGWLCILGYRWKFAGSFVGTVGFSALSGGIGAELSGGDFWRGATTGAMIGALNHMKHAVFFAIENKHMIIKIDNRVTAKVNLHMKLVPLI